MLSSFAPACGSIAQAGLSLIARAGPGGLHSAYRAAPARRGKAGSIGCEAGDCDAQPSNVTPDAHTLR
ncbi:hypothetical protein CUJ87_07420 [Paraburkholderia caledonica]|nr:hypothetical protein CUJ87_07420 [Paraburkholderia caledonica]